MPGPSKAVKQALSRRIRTIAQHITYPGDYDTLEGYTVEKGVLDQCRHDPIFPSLSSTVHEIFYDALRRVLQAQHTLVQQQAWDTSRQARHELEVKERELFELDASAGGMDFGYLRFRARIRQGYLDRIADLRASIRTANEDVLRIEAELAALELDASRVQ